MIKKIRKFSNMSILCITDNKKTIQDIQNKFKDAKNLLFLTTLEEIKNETKPYDILLLDYSISNALELLKELKLIKPMLPKIAILTGDDEKDMVDCINYGAYSILSNPISYNDLKLSIVMALNQSKRVDKVSLNHGIYYDDYRERFYNDNEAINFTRFEFDLLKLLLDNHNRIISYDEIKEKVWKEKKMSIFTMRNVVNKIRNKTYYEIIKNNSSSGYQIDDIQ
ncbi:response regulator transcription factor [Arcobacter sp. 15-2]|uniref:response regulator transcription factor n=1 Tax=Arcobacter sp. 15-2 TaxID=3374109 RepID=UPI00399CCAF5